MTRLQDCAVLIVDDEPLIAWDIAACCEAEGAKPIVAASVGQGLATALRERIDVAIVEYRLERGDCDSLCAQLKDRGIPFVTYTSWDRPNGECLAGRVLEKPIDGAVLVETLVQLVRDRP